MEQTCTSIYINVNVFIMNRSLCNNSYKQRQLILSVRALNIIEIARTIVFNIFFLFSKGREATAVLQSFVIKKAGVKAMVTIKRECSDII